MPIAAVPTYNKKKNVVTGMPSGYAPGGVTYAQAPPVAGVPITQSTIPLGNAATQQTQTQQTQQAQQPAANPYNYLAELEGDPVYQAAVNQYNAATQSGRLTLRDQIRLAIAGSGYDPTGQMSQMAGMSGFVSDIDPAALAEAAQNPYSTRAQIQNTLNKGLSNLRYRLAARGMERSGAAATGTRGLTDTSQQAGYQAMQALLSQIGGGISQFQGLQSGEAARLGATRESVASRLAQLASLAGTGGITESGGMGTTASGGPDWRTSAATPSGYSPGVASGDLAGTLFGNPNYDANADPELQRIKRQLGIA